MTDLNSLVIFAQVVEANSFSEAARRLKMPTSTVSRRVAELEDQLGVRLLERSTRNLRLADIEAEVLSTVAGVLRRRRGSGSQCRFRVAVEDRHLGTGAADPALSRDVGTHDRRPLSLAPLSP